MSSVHRNLVVWLSVCLFTSFSPASAGEQGSLAERVEIRRTTYGIPHILADDLASAFFGLAYCHLEDYGERVVLGLVRSRGELARYLGRDELDSDFFNRSSHARAVETFHLLDEDTRNVFRGYAAGVNHYIRTHAEELPEWVEPSFTPHDVAALWIGRVSRGKIERFLELQYERDSLEEELSLVDEAGSNAWAFAPNRTESGLGVGDQCFEESLHDGDEQGALVFEIAVDRAFDHARAGRDRCDRRFAIALFGEYASSGVENLRLSFRARTSRALRASSDSLTLL